MAKPLLLQLWLLAARGLPLRIISRYLHGRMGATPTRFSERLGQPGSRAEGPVIWFHGASLGEVSQIAPLVNRFSQAGQTILVTTTTQAGADWVARDLPDAIHQFAPMDTPGAVRGFLDAWEISVAVFIEGDFGPRLSLEAQKRGVPQVLLNARHSRTRERFPFVFSTLLESFTLVTCRSERVAKGLRALGVPDDKVKTLPDLRIATAKLPCPPDLLEAMKTQIGTRRVWVAASTHPADEAHVLAAHERVIEAVPDALLILAPRHPKRGDPLQAAARERGFTIARRSTGDVLTAETQVYLADTLGELGVFFGLAPVVFLGGSIGDEGGHNPYEPASFGAAILSGAKVKNFADAYAALSEVGAAELLVEPADLGQRLTTLFGSDQARAMGAAGQAFMEASENSVEETVRLLEGVLLKSE